MPIWENLDVIQVHFVGGDFDDPSDDDGLESLFDLWG